MTLAAGSSLGPYRIDSLVGEGGMGQVYRALDTRLDRPVAIKVLPPHLSSHPQLRERFEREARAISSLSHPNICTLFDVGNQAGVDFLVMEYLEGESLADRLTRGPLPLHEALRYGREIADALAMAHSRGIVHRDLKPGNVMITRSGARLLDFGLAKTAASAISSPDAPTEAHKPLTAEGTVLGTFQYMAPEQLEGMEADARTDIFALGAVLYEMVTGRRAFEGKSRTSLIAAIVDRDPPPIESLQPASPPRLERIIRTCLAKDPDARWQSARDLHFELGWIEEEGGTKSPPAGGRARTRWWAAALLAAVVAAAAITALLLKDRNELESPIALDIYPPQGVTFDPIDGPVIVSPDGRSVAALTDGGSLAVRDLTSREVRIFPVGGAYDLFWSPDSRSIGFFTQGRLRRIDLAGGQSRTIASVGDSRGGTWGPSGVIVFASTPSGGLSRVSATGGPVTPLTTLDPTREQGHWRPAFFPDGEHFLYSSRGTRETGSAVYVGSIDGMKPVRLMELDTAPVIAPPDRILFMSEDSLYAQKIDTRKWKPVGEPVVIAPNVEYSPLFGSLAASASGNGVFAWQEQLRDSRTTISRFDPSGKLQAVAVEDGGVNLDLSKDGSRIAYTRVDAKARSRDIWLVDLARGTQSRLTFDAASELGPVWSPDGSQIAFQSNRQAGIGVYLKAASGAGPETLVLGSNEWSEPVDWSMDGRYLLIEQAGDLLLLPLQEPRTPIRLPGNADFREHSGRFSPDGRFIIYASNETGRDEIYVQPFPFTGARWQISTGSGTAPRWRGDGKEVLFVDSSGTLFSAPVTTDGGFQWGRPRELFSLGDSVDYVVSKTGSEIHVSHVEKIDPQPIRLVLNWTAADG